MGDLSKDFSKSEFACKCGCGACDVKTHLINKLQALRNYLNRPLVITSGVRCTTHNKHEGGKSNSAHLKGLAVDIACTDSRFRYDLLEGAFALKFARIGVIEDAIHLDLSRVLPQRMTWLYPKKSNQKGGK